MVTLAIFYKLDKFLGKTPEFISHCGKNLNQYYIITYTITMQMNVFMKLTKGEEYSYQFNYTDLFVFILLVLTRILLI